MARAGAVLVFTTLFAVGRSSSEIFKKRQMCNLRDRIENGCFVQNKGSTRIECSVSCSRNSDCTKFVFSLQDKACYHDAACTFDPTCSGFDADLELYDTSNCQNGGEMINGVCNCSKSTGMVGEHCDTYPASCDDLTVAGYPAGDHAVTLDLNQDGSLLFKTQCVLQAGNVVEVDMIRSSGQYEAPTDFESYEKGYYKGPLDFFSGLLAMSQILATKTTVFVAVYYDSDQFAGRCGIKYWDVEMQDGASGYKTAVGFNAVFNEVQGKVSGQAVDTQGLIPQDPVFIDSFLAPFRAPDSGNECPSDARAGWWWRSCDSETLNPLGLNYKVLPGAKTARHFSLPGLTTSKVKDSFYYFRVYIEA